jgi:hypothetical protein
MYKGYSKVDNGNANNTTRTRSKLNSALLLLLFFSLFIMSAIMIPAFIQANKRSKSVGQDVAIYTYANDSFVTSIRTKDNRTHFSISGYWSHLYMIQVGTSSSDLYNIDNTQNQHNLTTFVYDLDGSEFSFRPSESGNDEFFMRFVTNNGSIVCLWWTLSHPMDLSQHHPHLALQSVPKERKLAKRKTLGKLLRMPSHHLLDEDMIQIEYSILKEIQTNEEISQEISIHFLTQLFQDTVYPTLETCQAFCSSSCTEFILQTYGLIFDQFEGLNQHTNTTTIGYSCKSNMTPQRCSELCDYGLECVHQELFCPIPSIDRMSCHTLGGHAHKMHCKCDEGFQGEMCDIDVDECNVTQHVWPCAPYGSACSNGEGYYFCTCNQGWEGNGTVCEFVGECLEQSGALLDDTKGCICPNVSDQQNYYGKIIETTLGAFTCIWGTDPLENGICDCGYELDIDLNFCVDINECAQLQEDLESVVGFQVGSMRCANTVGSFRLHNVSNLLSNEDVGCYDPSGEEYTVGAVSSYWCCKITDLAEDFTPPFNSTWSSPGCVGKSIYRTSQSNETWTLSECLPSLDPTRRCLCRNISQVEDFLFSPYPQESCPSGEVSISLTQCYCDNEGAGGFGNGTCDLGPSSPCWPNSHLSETNACVCNEGFILDNVSYSNEYITYVCCPCGFDSNHGNCSTCNSTQIECGCNEYWDSDSESCVGFTEQICNLYNLSTGISILGVTCNYSVGLNQIVWGCSNPNQKAHTYVGGVGEGRYLHVWCCDDELSYVVNDSRWAGSCLCNNLTLNSSMVQNSGCSTCLNDMSESLCDCSLNNYHEGSISNDLPNLCLPYNLLITKKSCHCHIENGIVPTGIDINSQDSNSGGCYDCGTITSHLLYNQTSSQCSCESGYVLYEQECMVADSCFIQGDYLCDSVSTNCIDDANGHYQCVCKVGYVPSSGDPTHCIGT